MRHVVIGTAGHVDHGKTTLVKRLTGVNTDRLKEEQERGLTIELGFAPFRLPSGRLAGIVDVPGHERFIHHMLAGAAGIDLVLLVIAADEGVMPQTTEHLDILTLLQVQRGVIVLTKTDLVDSDWVELVSEEIREKVKGTALADAPIIPVSAVTGEGIDRLVALVDELTATEFRERSAVLRLPVDRVFALTGHGTVVTGTLWGGRVSPGDTVAILPSGRTARVRQAQVHGESVAAAEAGQRVALNLVGVEKDEITRGEVVTAQGELAPTRLLDVRLNVLTDAAVGVAHRDRVRLHVGTNEVLARVRLLDCDEVEAGGTGYAQLHLEEPVVAVRGDLLVVRSYSPPRTLGGGRIIDAHPPRHRRLRETTLAELAREERGDPADLTQLALARAAGRPLTVERVMRATMLSRPRTMGELEKAAKAGTAVGVGEGYYVDAKVYAAQARAAETALADFHQRFPLRAGMPKEELRSRVAPKWEAREFSLLLEKWQAEKRVRLIGQEVSLAGHDPAVSAEQERKLADIATAFIKGDLMPPTLFEVVKELGLASGPAEELVSRLTKEGRLVKVSEELYYGPEALTRVGQVLGEHFATEKTLEASAFRDKLGITRKYAIPLLEYCDRIRWTRRVADVRIAGPALPGKTS